MPVNPDPNSGWASWLSQFLPQIGAPQPGNIVNSPAAGPSLGRLGLPQAMGGQGVYTAPGAPQQLPGAAPATPLGGSANPFVASAQGPMDPSIMARMAQQGTPGGGASGSWGPGPAAPSTAGPGGIGSDARFPMTALGGATGSWGPPSGQGAGAPMSGAPPGAGPSGGGIGGDWRYPTAAAPGTGGIGSDYAATARTAPGRPAPVASPAGALAQNSPFVQIARPNAPAGGAAYGRGGPPVMSALDLSRLFGRRPA